VFDVGTVLAGKYRVDRVIGRGGMGVVVAATHLHLQQPVALKFLLPDLVHSPQIMERFVREARASAQLRGEHVCRVSDVGTFETGAPYIVMELLHGNDLASVLDGGGAMPVQVAAEHVLQACVGVAEAHALGIVHRDLKPANLFLTRRPDGTPLIKVLDFGIAKAQNAPSFNLTQTSAVLGSPGYMSPEQLRSTRDVDVRSDIWSIGVILYELVSGRMPFTGDSITELALHIAMDPAPPLAGRMPPGFDLVVERCLAKEPAQRYPDLAHLAQALAPFAGPHGWDLAGVVSRLLQVSVPTQVLHVPYSTPAISTQAPISYSHASAAGHVATPTTMGSAASSMLIPGARAQRGSRWGVIAGVAATIVVAAALTLAAAGGSSKGGDPTARAPATVAPIAVPIDAGAAGATTALIDAAAVAPPAAPLDARVTSVDAMPVPADAMPVPADARARPHGRPPETREDFGESRF
jgi:eukaryotic-like serine/threonine-protein kinase